MVRVIPVHNFLGQTIVPITEPIASCVAISNDREMLLLAHCTHCVEVRDLEAPDLRVHTTFPTVDMVNEILHCGKGDYIATLESKSTREVVAFDNKNPKNSVRIYVNWFFINEGQPMRARIAGRVTPSLNRPLNSLEMIELPLDSQPTAIACCQSTGNLLVASGYIVTLHEFKIETQSTSKLKFIDFEARPWSLGFSFSPTRMEIIEDTISAMDSTHLHVFRLVNSMYEDIEQLSSTASTVSSNDRTFDSSSKDATSLPNFQTKNNNDYVEKESFSSLPVKTKSEKYEENKRTSSKSKTRKREDDQENKCIDWNRLVENEAEEMQVLVQKGILDEKSKPLTIDLPSISLERVGPGHALSPFILNPMDMNVSIEITYPDYGWSENYRVKHLLRLRISKTNEGIGESFTASTLKPLYLQKEVDKASCRLKKSMLKSETSKFLAGITCLVCTVQEGYFYHFPINFLENTSSSGSNPTCIATYPFTAPVASVALEHTVLHALTEVGLESYTARFSQGFARHRFVAEPICLIGLRPFFGIRKMLHAPNYLILLANDDSEVSWTLYTLQLPKPENLYYDILNVAKSHKTSSPSTYEHLLLEANSLLKSTKDTLEFKTDLKLISLYDQSCALLADFYVNSEAESNWNLAIFYYKLSGLKPTEVLARKCTANAPGLIAYLTDTLLTLKNSSEADALFQGHNVVEIISGSDDKGSILKLIFGSSILREYATEKLISLMCQKQWEKDDVSQLALVLLYILAEKHKEAEDILSPIADRVIMDVLLKHWRLLFDMTGTMKNRRILPSFSELSGILMRKKTTVFGDILNRVIEFDHFSLHQIIQIFLEYLPSRVGRDGHSAAASLQIFIETYFQKYFHAKYVEFVDENFEFEKDEKKDVRVNYDFGTIEAFKILVRSYLGRLMQSKTYHSQFLEKDDGYDKEDYLFATFRFRYLDKMPPFAKDYMQILTSQQFEFSFHDDLDSSIFDNDNRIPPEVFKLQALLASDLLPSECLHEVRQFLETQDIIGKLSLKILCTEDTETATRILVEECPQAVVQYAKDKFTKETEWKYLTDAIQVKLRMNSDNTTMQCFYNQMMKETLSHLAQILPLKSLHRILPKDNNEEFQRYTEVCSQALHADHVKSLIMETGQQLLLSLNL